MNLEPLELQACTSTALKLRPTRLNFISSRTVENHVSVILAKLGAASWLEAMALTERLGMIAQSV